MSRSWVYKKVIEDSIGGWDIASLVPITGQIIESSNQSVKWVDTIKLMVEIREQGTGNREQ
jgi:hypothetical protein